MSICPHPETVLQTVSSTMEEFCPSYAMLPRSGTRFLKPHIYFIFYPFDKVVRPTIVLVEDGNKGRQVNSSVRLMGVSPPLVPFGSDLFVTEDPMSTHASIDVTPIFILKTTVTERKIFFFPIATTIVYCISDDFLNRNR